MPKKEKLTAEAVLKDFAFMLQQNVVPQNIKEWVSQISQMSLTVKKEDRENFKAEAKRLLAEFTKRAFL